MKTGTGIAAAGLMIALALLLQGSNHHRYQMKSAKVIFDSHTGTVYERVHREDPHVGIYWEVYKLVQRRQIISDGS